MVKNKVFLRAVSVILSAVILAGAGSLSGCSAFINDNAGSEADGGNLPIEEENKQDKIMAEFAALVKTDPKPDAIIEYMDKNIEDMSRDNASIMLEELEKAQKNRLPAMEERYDNGGPLQNSLMDIFKTDFDIDRIYDIEDSELKSLLTETRNMGYKIETAEGMFFPIIDYRYVKKFSQYAAEDMKDYIDIMAAESDKVPAKDAALVIGWDEIIGRALAQEDFIKKHGNSPKAESIKELQKKYITFMLFGLNNTPLFSYDTKTMDPKAKETYIKAVKDNDGSRLMQLLGKYMEVLEKSNYKLSDEVDKFRKSAIEDN